MTSYVERLDDDLIGPLATATDRDLGLPDAVVRAALDQSSQATLITLADIDPPGPTVVHVNNAYLDLFCCDRNDIEGHSPRLTQGPLTDRGVLDEIRACLEVGAPVRAQAVNYRFDGEPFHLRWRIDPVYDGEVLQYFIAFQRDVTLELQLRHRLDASALLERAFRRAADDAALAPRFDEAFDLVLRPVGVSRTSLGVAPTEVEPLRMTADERAQRFVLGRHGVVDLLVRRDAGPLFDASGLDELFDRAVWLLDLLRPEH